jgi:hypothetical protein
MKAARHAAIHYDSLPHTVQWDGRKGTQAAEGRPTCQAGRCTLAGETAMGAAGPTCNP